MKILGTYYSIRDKDYKKGDKHIAESYTTIDPRILLLGQTEAKNSNF
jgi:hypothetical protein